MGQRFTITESERNRIKGLYEQSGPAVPPLGPRTSKDVTGTFKGETVNLYKDVQNKKLHITAVIKEIRRSDTSYFITFENLPHTYHFWCHKNYLGEIWKPGEALKLYSTPFVAKLKKVFCGVSTGGTVVPKANYTQSSSAPSDMV